MKCPTCLQNTIPDNWVSWYMEGDPATRALTTALIKTYGGDPEQAKAS